MCSIHTVWFHGDERVWPGSAAGRCIHSMKSKSNSVTWVKHGKQTCYRRFKCPSSGKDSLTRQPMVVLVLVFHECMAMAMAMYAATASRAAGLALAIIPRPLSSTGWNRDIRLGVHGTN